MPAATSSKARRARSASREQRSTSPYRPTPPSEDVIESRPKAKPKTRKRTKKTPVAPEVSVDDVLEAEDLAAAEALVRDAAEEALDEAAEEEAAEELAELIAENGDSVVLTNGHPITEEAIAAVDAQSGDEEPVPAGTARVTVTTDVQTAGDVETTQTAVKIQLPIGAGDVSLPDDPEEILKQAKKIVEEAVELQTENASATSAGTSRKNLKRKVDDVEEVIEEIVPAEEIAAELENGIEEPVAKRTRVMVAADEYRREKMQKRALIGLSATIAVGAIIPFVSTLF